MAALSDERRQIEQADGRDGLEQYHASGGRDGNRGDPGDFFPGPTGNTSFHFSSEPSSRTKGGKDTGVAITHISQPGDIMTIDVGGPLGVSIDASNTREIGYALHQNYPNPFSGSTTINFELAKASDVDLSVFDLTGRRIVALVLRRLSAGSHRVPLDASALPSGQYVYRLRAGEYEAVRSMVVVR